jgi:hypothetical protein
MSIHTPLLSLIKNITFCICFPEELQTGFKYSHIIETYFEWIQYSDAGPNYFKVPKQLSDSQSRLQDRNLVLQEPTKFEKHSSSQLT